MESSTFLIREQGLNLEPLAVPTTGFFSQGQVRDEVDRLFAVSSPPGDGENGSVPALCEECIGDINDISGSHVIRHVDESKFLSLPSQRRGFARPQYVLPSGLFNKGLKIDAIELAVAKHHHSCVVRNQPLYLNSSVQGESVPESGPFFSWPQSMRQVAPFVCRQR